MNEQHKNRIINKLGDLLPPFTEAVISLVEYIKNDREKTIELIKKLIEVITYSKKLTAAIGEEIEIIQDQLSKVKAENAELTSSFAKDIDSIESKEGKKRLDDSLDLIETSIKEVEKIQRISIRANDLINKGVYALMYILAKENNKLEDFKAIGNNIEIVPEEEITIDYAINNLYEGSKELVALIDLVLEE